VNGIPSLSERLPRLWKTAFNLIAELEDEIFRDRDALYRRLDFLAEPEWISIIETAFPGRVKIATQNNELTLKHTLMVLVNCLNLPEYQMSGAQTRRKIEWAAIPFFRHQAKNENARDKDI
jgi:hypothetical protein